MKITVNRFTNDGCATLSLVDVDGKFQCFGLEDEPRDVKVNGETRIPAGEYKIGIRDTGGFHGRYSKKFPNIHKGMLQVLNVPNFEYILIHVGNTDDDTAGCLLLGSDALTSGNRIGRSVYAYNDFYKKVINEAIEGNVTIEYIDNDAL